MKKEKQLCPLIDHGQQPMKMHTEVTLLYKVLSQTFNNKIGIKYTHTVKISQAITRLNNPVTALLACMIEQDW